MKRMVFIAVFLLVCFGLSFNVYAQTVQTETVFVSDKGDGLDDLPPLITPDNPKDDGLDDLKPLNKPSDI